MNKVKEQIANFFTLLNLASGVLGVIFILNGDLMSACLCVFAGAVFDFFDGFVARALGIASEMGKQLDSLSDVVTFGVVPGLIAHHLFVHALGTPASVWSPALLALLIPCFSALRLAKFNIDPNQSKNFRGLPTPPNGLFWASLGFTFSYYIDLVSSDADSISFVAAPSAMLGFWETVFISQAGVVLILIVATSLMLVMPLSLFGFKFDKFTWKGNETKFLLLLICIPLVVIFQFAAAPIILLLYIIFSIIHFYVLKKT